MPSADKRARKKENSRAAREEREAALKRKKRNRSIRNVGIVVGIFVIVIVLLNLGSSKKKNSAAVTTTSAPTTTTTDPKLDPGKTYTATITTNFGKIELAMDTKKAPIAAAHFIALARGGVYNGSKFRRVVKTFMIQGGAPGGDPARLYGKSVVGEVPTKYALGDVAAAKRTADPNGNFDSQFFIVTGAEGEALPPQYADFAHVTGGMAVVHKIEGLANSGPPNNDPTQPVTITTVVIKEA